MTLEHVLEILRGGDFVSREGGVILLSCVLVMLVAGLVVGLSFWKQFRVLATMIESDTRQNQSDYDLVSRDIVKIKQGVAVRAKQIPNSKT